MKLHTIVLSLTLAATAAHADLFEKLKKIEKDVSELKEAIEEVGSGEDEAEPETADTTESPEDSASAVQQGAAANVPVENKSSPATGGSRASAGQNLYGWLDSVRYDDRGNPQYPYTRVSLGVSGVSTSRTTGIPCNRLYLDSSLPQIDGISVGDLSGKSVAEINQAFVPHRGKFVRLNNVQVHPQGNQRTCVAASVSVVDFAKANVTFSEVRGFFHERVVNAAIRADMFTPPIVAPDTIIRPEEYECTFYQWASADAANAWYEEWQQSGYPSPKSFRMEFVGVHPVDEIGHCEFDTMNIVANEAQEPKAATAASPAHVDTATQRRFSITLRNDAVYINGMALGMPEQEVKEEFRRLNYETEDYVQPRLDLTDGESSLTAQILSGKLASVYIQERPVSNEYKDEIIDSLSASFGDKISCQERRVAGGRTATSCAYPKNAPGGHYSLQVGFISMREGYNLSINLK